MESMKCPSCGSPDILKESPVEYKCQNCGTKSKLSPDHSTLVLINGYQCPSCGFVNEAETRFCGNCGKKLLKTCPSCNKEIQLEKRFCPNCGLELTIADIDVKFRMKIDDVFMISGIGLVAAGKIELGTIKIGDEISFLRDGVVNKENVLVIEQFREKIKSAKAGMTVGLLISHKTINDIRKGDLIFI